MTSRFERIAALIDALSVLDSDFKTGWRVLGAATAGEALLAAEVNAEAGKIALDLANARESGNERRRRILEKRISEAAKRIGRVPLDYRGEGPARDDAFVWAAALKLGVLD